VVSAVLCFKDGTSWLYPHTVKGTNAEVSHDERDKEEKGLVSVLKPFYKGTNLIHENGALIT
jgi:hypothetical protein